MEGGKEAGPGKAGRLSDSYPSLVGWIVAPRLLDLGTRALLLRLEGLRNLDQSYLL